MPEKWKDFDLLIMLRENCTNYSLPINVFCLSFFEFLEIKNLGIGDCRLFQF